MFETTIRFKPRSAWRPGMTPEKLVDTNTLPLPADVVAKPAMGEDTAAPLPLDKTFDSFDATLRLADGRLPDPRP